MGKIYSIVGGFVFLVCGAAHAQFGPVPLSLGTAANTAAAGNDPRFATYSPVTFGAVCDGRSHPISSTSLPHTVAGLAAYTVNGATPYAWLANGSWKFHVALPVPGGAASGATKLTVYPLITGLAAGQTVTGTGIPAGDTIASVSPASGPTLPFITLTSALAASMPAYHSSSGNTNYIEISGSALTDAQVAGGEVDWLGTQAAIQAVMSAGGGNLVMPGGAGPGAGCVMSNANSPGTMMGTLVLPAASSGSVVTETNLVSNGGVMSGLISWPTDLGAGRCGISDDVPWADPANGLGRYSFTYYVGHVEHVRLSGPVPYFTAGASPSAAMTGYCEGPRRVWNEAQIGGFWNGVSKVGDHTPWMHVDINSNQNFDVYWDYPNSSLAGDNEFYSVLLDGAGLAAMGVNYAATIGGFLMESGYIANNPFGIYCEAPPAGASSIGCLGDSMFRKVNMEWNAGFLYDASGDTYTYSGGAVASTTIGTKTRQINRNTIDTSYMSLAGYGGPNPSISARPVRATIDIGQIDGLKLIGWTDFVRGGTHGDAGTAYMIYAGNVGATDGGLYIEGNINGLMSALNASGLSLINGGATNQIYNTTLVEPGVMEARLFGVDANYCYGGVPAVGQLVELNASCGGWAVGPAGIVATAGVFGVLGNLGSPGIIVTRSRAINVPSVGTIAAGQYVTKYLATSSPYTGSGSVAAWTSASATPPIGKALSAVSGGTSAAPVSLGIELLPQQ